MSRTEPGAKTARRFHPNVIALGFTSFFTDISSEMLVPVTPWGASSRAKTLVRVAPPPLAAA